MAWPKGLSRKEAEKMKLAGTFEAWLEDYRLANPHDAAINAAPKGAPKAAKAPKADPLTALNNKALDLIAAIEATPLGVAYEIGELDKLQELKITLETVMGSTQGAVWLVEAPIQRLEKEAELVERMEAAEAENEALKAKLAEMQEALRVAGHSDKIPAPRAAPRASGRPKVIEGGQQPAA